MAFVHLHNHTEYSLLDGATRVTDMVQRAAELGMPAVAITDHGYMYGVPALVNACAAHNKAVDEGEAKYPNKVKPIIGCEIYFTPDSELRRDRKPELYHMILIAKNNVGYHNLMELVSEAAVEGYYYRPRTTYENLAAHAEGLIGTSACIAGIIPSNLEAGMEEEARSWARKLSALFAPGDFYIELQDQGLVFNEPGRHGLSQNQLNHRLSDLARELGLKTIATNDFHYLRQEDAACQDLMLCIGTGSKIDEEDRLRFENDQFYMKTEEEMRQVMKDFPEACDNTLEVAAKCDVTLSHDLILPALPLPEGETNESMLRKESLVGLKERYGDPLPQRVMDQFEHEYKIICSKGFAAYFLIVQEFTRWAKQNGIGVGPGRGSAAGSIISYALDITTFDPLENGLLFERFLSPERDEMPDIDMDFDDERRGDVIEHVRQVYGTDHIANVITFSTMKAKQAINDACRVLDYPVYKGQQLSKLISSSPKASLKGTLGIHEKAQRNEEDYNPDFKDAYEKDPDARKIIDAALSLEGITRGEGVHASAVIICRDPVQMHVPVKYDTKGSDGAIITQYDGTANANLGLLKMDFLGLRTLTVISKAIQYIKENHGIEIRTEDIPFDDPAVFDLFARGDTSGVFQVESDGMVSLLKQMKPDCYSDIVAVIALFRPGPMKMIPDFIARKQGRKAINYYDDRLKDILAETYGIMVYQEQVMLISITMSGFDAGESDKLRKAVAKKKIAMMTTEVSEWHDGTRETMADHWLNGAVRNGYSKEVAQTIWNDVLEFAEYAFNKSHAAAYGILTMQTAWLKAHYPTEYMAAVLTSHTGKTDKLNKYIVACRKGGIPVLPPDVNSSHRDFTATPQGVRFGIAGIRNVGESVADAIIAERDARGPFSSLHDFVDRVDATAYNRKALESLVKAGAFDSTGYTRRQLMAFVDDGALLESAAKRQKDRSAGQTSLFDMFGDEGVDVGFQDDAPAPDGVEWDRRVKLSYEKEIMGMYVSDHPLSLFREQLDQIAEYSLGDVAASAAPEETMDGMGDGGEESSGQATIPDDHDIILAGMVTGFGEKITKRGEKMAVFNLEDTEGTVSCVIFTKPYADSGDILHDDAIVKVKGRYSLDDRGVQIKVSNVWSLDLKDSDVLPRPIEIQLASNDFNQQLSSQLNDLFARYPGKDSVTLRLSQADGHRFKASLPVTVDGHSDLLLAELADLVGEKALVV